MKLLLHPLQMPYLLSDPVRHQPLDIAPCKPRSNAYSIVLETSVLSRVCVTIHIRLLRVELAEPCLVRSITPADFLRDWLARFDLQ